MRHLWNGSYSNLSNKTTPTPLILVFYSIGGVRCGSLQIDFTLSNWYFPVFALACVSFAYFQSQQRGGWSVCDYVDFLFLTSVEGGGCGVWATEKTVFGCFLRWPAAQAVPVADPWLSEFRGCWRT